MKLSILIPTIKHREEMFKELFYELRGQINRCGATGEVEVLFNNDAVATIGAKRNDLLSRSTGEYVCFIDDDDTVSKDYVKLILEAIEKKPDCVSLKGVLTVDGKNPEIFEHSIKYSEWETVDNPTNGIKYLRCPNHLNCIKASIAKDYPFVESNFGEDKLWSVDIKESGRLKSEIYIDEVLYHYKYVSDKK